MQRDMPCRTEETEEEEEAGDGIPVSPLTVVETLLFVGSIDNQPLESAKAADLMRGVTPGDVAELVDELNARYRSNGCPYKIVSDGAGYRMALRQAFNPVRNKFYGQVREARLSQAAIDTLAIVAYRQPLTSEQVTQLRGTPSGHLLTQLTRRQLLDVERVEGSRQVLYRTSNRFLELFGLDSLEDLPDSE
jgi:segregation and condensation protein B